MSTTANCEKCGHFIGIGHQCPEYPSQEALAVEARYKELARKKKAIDFQLEERITALTDALRAAREALVGGSANGGVFWRENAIERIDAVLAAQEGK